MIPVGKEKARLHGNKIAEPDVMPKIVQLLKQTYSEWSRDQASRLAAALAYYTIFSLAPVLVIVIAVAGFVWGQADVRTQLIVQIQNSIGENGAQLIESLLDGASRSGGSLLASLIGTATLILGALGVFNELQSSLNFIWKIEPEQPQGIPAIIKNILIDRLASFGLILGIGLLLLASLVASTVIAGLPIPSLALQALDLLISFILMTLLFAMIYKILPDAEIAWRDVWSGAGVTSLLFAVGKYLVGLYLGNSAASSAFGAAGSLALLLVWIYYSAQIFFFGAEFTQVYANRFGSKIVPEATTSRKESESVPARASARPVSARPASARPGPALESRFRRRQMAEPGRESSPEPSARPGLIVLSVLLASLIAGILVERYQGES